MLLEGDSAATTVFSVATVTSSVVAVVEAVVAVVVVGWLILECDFSEKKIIFLTLKLTI